MAKENTLSKIEGETSALATELGFELVDVEFVKEGQNWYLRFYIDKEGGIGLDDCELFSRRVEVTLDELNPIEQTYILEVSSPGIDRPLKKPADFEKFKGRLIDVKLYKAQNNKKAYQGVLLGLSDDVISLEDAEEIFNFNTQDVASVKLAITF